MEPPPFYHHRRYVSPPPSSENPNFYNHQHLHPHQHRLPPPPPPPSHPRPSLPPLLPSPTSFQFSYRPRHYSPSDYPPPPRSFRHSPARDPAPRSLPFYEQNSNRWSDLPPPPPPRDHHHLQRRPPSPVGNYVNDYGRDFRFRGEGGYRDREFSTTDYVDDEKYRYSSFSRDFERNSGSRFERNFDIADSQAAGRVRSYDSYSDRNEDSRWGYSRSGNENEYMDGDDGLRRELVESGYNYVGRLKSKIVVESQEFFNRSPMKQQVAQKKSALLRIGKTNNKNQHWNRGQEDSRYSRGYYDGEESDSSLGGNIRGKLEYDFVDREAQIDVKRGKTPVELDVSFKSNALVAKEVSTTDPPRMKLNDYFVKASGPSLSSLSSERSHEELKEKADSYDGGLDSLAHASHSVSDKDHRAHVVDGRTGGIESKSVADNQDVDIIAPDVVEPGKQNCDSNSLRQMDVDDKLSGLDNSSSASFSMTSQLEKVEGASHLRGKVSSGEKRVTNDVILSEYMNIASEGGPSDAKENGICSSVPVSLEHSASIYVPSTQGNGDPSHHVDKLIDNEHSRFSSEGGLVDVHYLSDLVSKDTTAQSHNVDDGSKHPCLSERVLPEISFFGDDRNFVHSSGPSLTESEARDAQIENSTPNLDALTASDFDQGMRPGNVTGMEIFSTDPAVNSSPKLERLLVHEDAGNNLSSGSAANSLESRTLSGIGFLNQSSEQSIVDGESTIQGNSIMEKSRTSFFDLAVVGRKRKVTDGQLDVPVVKASKLARPSVYQDESFILLGKNPESVENEVVGDDGQISSGKCSIEEGPTVLNHQIKGSKTKGEFTLIQKSPVTPEVSQPSTEPSAIEQDLNQTTDSVAHLWRDKTILMGLSSHFEAPENKFNHETSHNHLSKEKISVAVSSSDLKSNNCLPVEGYQGNYLGTDSNQKPSLGGVSCVNFLPIDDSATSSDSTCPTNSIDGQINSLPDTLSNMASPEDLSNFGSDVFNKLIPVKPPPLSSKVGTQSGGIVTPVPTLNSKAATSIWNPSKVSWKMDPFLKTSTSVSSRLNSSVVKAIPGQMLSKYSAAIKVAPSSHIAKPRTWHRTLNAQPLVSEPKTQSNYVQTKMNSNKDVSKVQGSYVRRGNTLVRKSPQVSDSHKLLTSQSSVCHLSSAVSPGVAGRLNICPDNQQSAATSAGTNSALERLKTSPLVGSIRSSSSNPLDLAVLPPANPVSNCCPDETSKPCKSAQSVDTKRSVDEDMKLSKANQRGTVSSNYLDCQSNGDEENSGEEILYLKRKSNQLVAASNTSDVLLPNRELSTADSSDAYVKRRKNQLIRTALNTTLKHGAVIDAKSSSLQQDSQNHVQIRNSSKRLSVAGYNKKNFSLVWTLNGNLSSRKDGSSGRLQRVLPNLFPWKRASSWTNHVHCLSSFSNDGNAISQKLRLSRKREAIYKRSLNGFSLTRSKVLGVGGCNLKWSKSMEKNSRKANTEATLAVAAAEKRKKAQNLASLTLYKSGNNVSRKSGERIFRIGSERYKMDPTRRTLQRIPDEQGTCSGQSEKKEKKVYVPSRLLIGNDKYVRVGNGNKLVRDPKRRTRILANEKLRWSLHTARLRLARKKQYCQFFTRFGKCKDDKKCPYIHDPSKIAVCTKFLLGSCSDHNCKLTHKVIPERMQDCSYFLQGLCSNGSCPYRHVNTNLKAPVCEGFLRGYCADGDECLKKHTRVCPVFEATGSCQVPECKLHHPKKKVKLTKRRVPNPQKNARGRYFGSPHINIGHGLTRTCEPVTGKGDGSIDSMEFAGDYIALDINVDEMDLVFEPRSEPVYDRGETLSDVEMDEDDELTKPMRLLNKS